MSSSIRQFVFFGVVADRGSDAGEMLRQMIRENGSDPTPIGSSEFDAITLGDLGDSRSLRYAIAFHGSVVDGYDEDSDDLSPKRLSTRDNWIKWTRILIGLLSHLGMRQNDFGEVGLHLGAIRG